MKFWNFDLVLNQFDPEMRQFWVSAKGTNVDVEPDSVRVTLSDDLEAKQAELSVRGSLDDAGLIALGKLLAQVLLPTELPGGRKKSIRASFEEARTRCKNDEGIRLRLWIGNNALADIPWEFTYLEEDDVGFLVLKEKIALIRRPVVQGAPIPDKQDYPPVDKIRLIVLMSNPDQSVRFSKLNLQAEAKGIRDGLKKVAASVDATFYPDELNPATRVTRKALLIEAIEKMHVLHFGGHGTFVTEMGEAFRSIDGMGHLVFSNDKGEEDLVSAKDLADALEGRGLRLVLLSACEGAKTSKGNPWSSVAAALIKAGIPAVVGMQYKVVDENATEFSEAFFRKLAEGHSVEQAMYEGRRAIRFLKGAAERDWGIPALYLRMKEGDENELVLFPREGSSQNNSATNDKNHPTGNISPSLITQRAYDRATWTNDKVRTLLTESFGVDQTGFTTLCADIPDIAPVRFMFTGGMDARIQTLIDFCDANETWVSLLKAVDKKFPKRFKRILSE